ncbi:MAG: putative integral membrane protein (TIGR00698 family) [Candidatus Marinamargulisbacteria bacterium]
MSGWVDASMKNRFSALTQTLLKVCVIGVGFGLTFEEFSGVGIHDLTVIGSVVCLTLASGYLLSRKIRIPASTAILITVGTAICGGSAIATISPIIQAKRQQLASSLAVVFLLNAVGMFLFPFIGRAFGLSDSVFGLWSAIAIHDTSSVIGASAMYSDHALKMAVLFKSIRTLFIIPIAIWVACSRKTTAVVSRFPWFLILFLLGVFLVFFFPQGAGLYSVVYVGAKRLIAVPIFLVGVSLSPYEMIKQNGKDLVFAVCLWALLASLSLGWLVLI